MTSSTEISFDKPGYDGRLNYHAILKGYMVAIAQASYEDNYQAWAKLLRDMCGFVAPFIKSDDAQTSKNEIDKCESVMNISKSCIIKSNESAMLTIVRKKLRDATDNLYSRSKHLLLPVKSDSEQILDEDEFMKGSDL